MFPGTMPSASNLNDTCLYVIVPPEETVNLFLEGPFLPNCRNSAGEVPVPTPG